MLVDRILSIEGEPLVLSAGRVVTEHTIRPDAWYLDHGRIPTCIAVEAGQADLFLSGYLGIDLHTRGGWRSIAFWMPWLPSTVVCLVLAR